MVTFHLSDPSVSPNVSEKLIERMVAERIYHYIESRGIFDHQQVRFRKGRGCEDQAARIIQAIQDGFNYKPMKRSVL